MAHTRKDAKPKMAWIKNKSAHQKAGIVGIALTIAGLMTAGGYGIATHDYKATAISTVSISPTNTKPATASNLMSPTRVAIDYTNKAAEGVDVKAVQKAADSGMTNFYTWNAGESSSARLERYKAFFTFDSSALKQAPDSIDVSKIPTNGLVSNGTIDYINPVSGSATEYTLTMGVTLKGQYNYSATTDQKSMILEKKETVTVHMVYIDNTWKIKDFAPSE